MFKKHIDYDLGMESAVLGVCLLEKGAYGQISTLLMPECFYKSEHLQVYNALADLYAAVHPLDLLTVTRSFYDKGITTLDGFNTPYFLTSLTLDVVSSAHLEYWCIKLRELAIRRESIRVTRSGIDSDADPLEMAQEVNTKMKALLDIRTADDFEHSSKVHKRLLKRRQERRESGGDLVTSGSKMLDRLNTGFKPKDLIYLAARPAVGKSAYAANNIAIGAARQGRHVGIITLEMDSMDLLNRMISYVSGVDFQQIDKEQFHSDAERQAAERAEIEINNLPIFFSDRAQVNMNDIRAKAERMQKRHGLDILIIDYLQLVEPDKNSKIREQEISAISRGLKLLAGMMNIPVVALCQLNRQADGQEPKLIHLRESGSLEQDADIVLMLDRPGKDEPGGGSEAFLYVRKWRNGEEGRIPMDFTGPLMSFDDKAEEWRTGKGEIVPDNPRAGIPTTAPKHPSPYEAPPF